jgi:transglutaminase-like putative cysteine protease
MKFKIQHTTNYQYSQLVKLSPQDLRFYPRDDGSQRVINFQLNIDPIPHGRNDHLDLEGNRVIQVWFEGETNHFNIQLNMEVETLRKNAFDFILASEAEFLPINHVEDFIFTQGYLERISPDNAVFSFAKEISRSVNNNTLGFLNTLSQKLFEDFIHIHRESGIPQTPGHTLQTRHGACRDLAVLFIDSCRSQGIAARFASGYQKGDLKSERRHLHAWPEVYLPGAGWIGYDPTHGMAIADTHVTIAAAAHARDTMPVTGSFIGEMVTSTLNYMVQIQVS